MVWRLKVSLIDKIALGLFLALALTVIGEGLYIRSQKAEHAAMKITNQSLTDALSQANKTIEQQKQVAKATDEVVTSTAKVVNDNNIVKDQLTKKVNEVSQQVANEQITDGVADATYARSMWTAYCKANPSDNTCP